MPALKYTPAERLRIKKWVIENDIRFFDSGCSIANVVRFARREIGLVLNDSWLGREARFWHSTHALEHWHPDLPTVPSETIFTGHLLERVQLAIRDLILDGSKTMAPQQLAGLLMRNGGPRVSADAVEEARKLMLWPKEKPDGRRKQRR